MSMPKHGQTSSPSGHLTISENFGGYGARLRTDSVTKRQLLQEDSTFECYVNSYQDICTELGSEKSFTGKPSAPNVTPDNLQAIILICADEKKISNYFLGLSKNIVSAY